jgi:hypothetical protein
MRRRPLITSLDAGLILTPPLILVSLHPEQGINWRMACHQEADVSHSAFPAVVQLAMCDALLSSSSKNPYPWNDLIPASVVWYWYRLE